MRAAKVLAFLTWLAAPVAAFAQDEPIRAQLPPEGAWVKYELSFTDLRDVAVYGNAKVEIVLKVLGAETLDGTKCRWIEFELKSLVKELGPQIAREFSNFDSGTIKLLVTEAGVQQADQEIRVITFVSQINEGRPKRYDIGDEQKAMLAIALQAFFLADDLLLEADALPASLTPRLMQFSSLQQSGPKEILEKWLIREPVVALGIRTRERRRIVAQAGEEEGFFIEVAIGDDLWTLQFEVASKAPLGIQSFRFAFKFRDKLFGPNAEIVEFGEIELRVLAFGDGAESALPDPP